MHFALALFTLAHPAAAADAPTIQAASGKGFTITSADGNFALGLRGRIQLRQSFNLEDSEYYQQTQVRTARVYLFGHTLTPDLTYVVQLAVAPNDFRDGTLSPVYDAYLDYQANDWFSLRVGQYFVPFDRSRTTREWALQLPERPRSVAELTLDRDVGITATSEVPVGIGALIARLGVFGGAGNNALLERPPGALGVARLEWHPMGKLDDADVEGDLERRAKPALALGLGLAYNHQSPRTRSTTGATWASGTANNLHFAADLVAKWHGTALIAELLRRDIPANTLLGPEGPRSGWGWLTQASQMLTDRAELAARIGQLRTSPDAEPTWAASLNNSHWELDAGASYYLNGHRFKLQAGWQALFDQDFGSARHGIAAQADVSF